ncbi:hypothetical protein [Streptomyces sp. NPDC088350]|uniref:hypothetical protein n=1 Tax=Streptomyces sp. NPDC088350 TaxID=3365854 RepID=UPI00381C8975
MQREDPDMPVDLDDFDADQARAEWRLSRYGGLGDDPAVVAAYKAFHQQIRYEVELQNLGYSDAQIIAQNTADGLRDVVDPLVGELYNRNAFHAPAMWWVETQGQYGRDEFAQQVAEKADYAREHGHLWGRTGPMAAEKIAEAEGGMILEQAPPAVVSNEIHYGTDGYPSYPPTLKRLWDEYSKYYVGDFHGVVNVNTFRGIAQPSVLADIEIPEILRRIENGEDVPHIRINEVHMNSNGELETKRHFIVHSQESFDKVPRSERTPSYVAQQNQLYTEGKEERRKLYNMRGLQNSLPGFGASSSKASSSKGSSKSTRVYYVLSHPDAPHVELTESPKSISRRASQASSNAQKFGLTEMLDQKLAVLAYAQGQRQGSASTGSQRGLDRSMTSLSLGAPLAPVNTQVGTYGSSYSNSDGYSPTNMDGLNTSAYSQYSTSSDEGVGAPLDRTEAHTGSSFHYDDNGLGYTSDYSKILHKGVEYNYLMHGTDEKGLEYYAYKNSQDGTLGVFTFGNSEVAPMWEPFDKHSADQWAASQTAASSSNSKGKENAQGQGKSRHEALAKFFNIKPAQAKKRS